MMCRSLNYEAGVGVGVEVGVEVGVGARAGVGVEAGVEVGDQVQTEARQCVSVKMEIIINNWLQLDPRK